MNYFYNIPETKLNQFKNDFHKVIKLTKEILINYRPYLAEDFEKNAESFLQIINSVKEMKHLKNCE